MKWQLKDGAWLESFSARGPTPVVILPAELCVATRLDAGIWWRALRSFTP